MKKLKGFRVLFLAICLIIMTSCMGLMYLDTFPVAQGMYYDYSTPYGYYYYPNYGYYYGYPRYHSGHSMYRSGGNSYHNNGANQRQGQGQNNSNSYSPTYRRK